MKRCDCFQWTNHIQSISLFFPLHLHREMSTSLGNIDRTINASRSSRPSLSTDGSSVTGGGRFASSNYGRAVYGAAVTSDFANRTDTVAVSLGDTHRGTSLGAAYSTDGTWGAKLSVRW